MDRRTIWICDLDGTLLRDDATLSPASREGLNRLLDAGAQITVASARSTAAMRPLLEGVAFRLPVIELNGAFVSELETGRHVVSRLLERDAAVRAVEIIAETGADAVLTSWDGTRDRVHHGPRTNPGTAWYVEEKRAYGDPRLSPCADLLDVARREAVASVVAFVREAEAPAVAARLEEALPASVAVAHAPNGYCPGWSEIGIQAVEAEKGAAIPALLDACGHAGAEVAVCGDHLNDLGMFAVADWAVSPANAHPLVRSRASCVVDSNERDGIVRYLLERHGLRMPAAC